MRKILPIKLALCLMFFSTYYAQNNWLEMRQQQDFNPV